MSGQQLSVTDSIEPSSYPPGSKSVGRINGMGMGMMLGLALLTGGCVMGEESYYYSPYDSNGGYYYEPGYSGTVIYRQSPPPRASGYYYERSRNDYHRDYRRDDHRRDNYRGDDHRGDDHRRNESRGNESRREEHRNVQSSSPPSERRSDAAVMAHEQAERARVRANMEAIQGY
eukprot:RCo039122